MGFKARETRTTVRRRDGRQYGHRRAGERFLSGWCRPTGPDLNRRQLLTRIGLAPEAPKGIRNRHMALKALSPWGVDKWHPDAKGLLEKTLKEEPDEEVRGEIETLLAGKEIEEPHFDVGQD